MEADPIEAHLARVAEVARAPDPAVAGARLAALGRLIHAWNQRMNLTGHRTVEAIARRLVAPAAGLAAALPEPIGSVADLGSGAGIPGLPLALVRPGTRFVLVDSRERRHLFQREAIRALGLADQVEAVQRRAELPAPERFDLVISQAMAPPEQALGWMLGWVAPGGWLAIPVSDPVHAPPQPPGVNGARARPYRLPGDRRDRWVWLARARA